MLLTDLKLFLCSDSAAHPCHSLAGGTALRNAYFGQGTGPILLDELACSGTERMLINCTSDGLGVHNCVHGEDAGVRCVGE